MTIPIIITGNSREIRLPKTILNKYNMTNEVESIMEEEFLIIKPKPQPRVGWDTTFKKIHKNGDDRLVINDIFEDE